MHARSQKIMRGGVDSRGAVGASLLGGSGAWPPEFFLKFNAKWCILRQSGEENCSLTNFKKICYDKPGNVPNKGRNFNTQKFGKMYLFVICMISRQ